MLMAEIGLEYWNKNNLDKYDYVLLLVENDNELNKRILKALNERKGKKKAYVAEGQEALALMRLYSMYEFTDKIIIGSFKQPCGRKAFNLLGCNLMQEEELISNILLGDVKPQ